MAQSIFPASTGDEWVLISSVTPSVASTVSFTSISGYKKLLLAIRTPGLSGTIAVSLTLNSDTGTNYAYSGNSYTTSTGALTSIFQGIPGSATSINLGTHSSANLASHFVFNDTNTAGMKSFSGFMIGGAGANISYPSIQGAYFASASISTVTLTTATGTFIASGTVALYGVKI